MKRLPPLFCDYRHYSIFHRAKNELSAIYFKKYFVFLEKKSALKINSFGVFLLVIFFLGTK